MSTIHAKCPKCAALVADLPLHEDWHERLTKEVRSAGGPLGIMFPTGVDL